MPRAGSRPLSSARSFPGRAEQDGDGLGWAGSPAGPTVTHRLSPGPLGAGGRRVPEGFAPGLRGGEAPKEQDLSGGGGRPEASNPVHGEEEGLSSETFPSSKQQQSGRFGLEESDA